MTAGGDPRAGLCALYCRLSKEDAGRTEESESIQNQKAILFSFAAARGLRVYRVYVDEDYSGADDRRPAFRALLADAAAGRFSAVLCKSQSRFTRDMETVETYIHGLFPQWGIRFLSVTDCADSLVRGNKKARQINGLVNEWYLEDLSENIRAVLDCKRSEGRYIGSFALYGYRKDPEDRGRLLPDEPAAAVVRRIYALFLGGMSTRAAAALLNREGVPSPARYKAGVYPAYPGQSGPWTRTAVARILKNGMYAGELIQGRSRKVSYKSPQRRSVPESRWFRSAGVLEPLISPETAAAARAMLACRTRAGAGGTRRALSGLLRCGVCGRPLVLHTGGRGGAARYLRCGACGGRSVRCDALEAAVLGALKARLAPCRADSPNGRDLLPAAVFLRRVEVFPGAERVRNVKILYTF